MKKYNKMILFDFKIFIYRIKRNYENKNKNKQSNFNR